METFTNEINGSQSPFFGKHKTELQPIFRTCCAYLHIIRGRVSTEDEIAHIDRVDQTLRWASAQTTLSVHPVHVSIVLLLRVLGNLYEVVGHYVDSLQVFSNTDASGIISHGQVHVSIEKMTEDLHLTDSESQTLEKYLHEVQHEIQQASENEQSTLAKVLIEAEIWSDQIAALALIVYPRYVDKVKDSVLIALERIRELLETGTAY
jgi:hypothetical protein